MITIIYRTYLLIKWKSNTVIFVHFEKRIIRCIVRYYLRVIPNEVALQSYFIYTSNYAFLAIKSSNFFLKIIVIFTKYSEIYQKNERSIKFSSKKPMKKSEIILKNLYKRSDHYKPFFFVAFLYFLYSLIY